MNPYEIIMTAIIWSIYYSALIGWCWLMLNYYQFLYEIKNLLKPHESQAERWMIWLTIVLVNNFFFCTNWFDWWDNDTGAENVWELFSYELSSWLEASWIEKKISLYSKEFGAETQIDSIESFTNTELRMAKFHLLFQLQRPCRDQWAVPTLVEKRLLRDRESLNHDVDATRRNGPSVARDRLPPLAGR